MAAFTYTVAQYEIATKPFTGADTITIADTQSILEGLSAAKIAEFVTNNVDIIDSLDNVLSWNVAQWDAAVPQLSFDDDDFLILSDSGAAIGAASASLIGQIAAAGATLLSPTDGEVTLSLAQYNALGGMSIDTDADGTLSDTGTNLETLTVGQIGALALKGVDVIDASDDEWTLSVAKFQALGDVDLTGDDEVTLSDGGATIAGLSVAELGALAGAGIDIVYNTDQMNLTVAQYEVLADVEFDGAGSRNIFDLGANISGLDFGDASDDGFTVVHATDGAFSITVEQYREVGDLFLYTPDTITLADTGANISGLTVIEIQALEGYGVDLIDSTGGDIRFTVAQYDGLSIGVNLTASDVTVVADTQANLEGLDNANIQHMNGEGIDFLDSDNGVLNLNVTKTNTIVDGHISATAADTVTVTDTGGWIGSMSAVNIGLLAANNFDLLNATDDVLALTKAQYLALGTVGLTAGDANSITDTGANIASFTAAQIDALDTKLIDSLNASDDTLDLTVAQYGALGTVALTGGDTVTLKDTGSALGGLSNLDYSQMSGKGVDVLDATDDVLSLSLQKALLAQSSGVIFAAGDLVTVLDNSSGIQSLTATQISNLSTAGVDVIDSIEGAYNLTAAQATAVYNGAITLTAADTVTLRDTAANIEALSSSVMSGLAADNIDAVDSTTDLLSLSVSQYVWLGDLLTATDTITLADTGANIAGMTDAQFGGLGANGVDQINATNNSLALTVAKYRALGAVNLTGADVVTLRDSGANLGTLSNAEISALAGKKIDAIDATDNALSISIAQFNALGSVQLASGDVVTLSDTSANIEALSAAQLISLGGKGVDKIDASNNVLTLSVNKYLNLGVVTLVGADVVTLSDTSANIEALTLGQFGALKGNGVDIINTTDNTLSLTVAKAVALNGVSVHASDSFVIRDNAANLEALTSSEIAALAAAGVDQFNANGTATVNLTAADVAALGTIALANGDTWVLNDTGASIAALSAPQIGPLGAKGLDSIDATDDVLNLNVEQYRSLGGLTLASGDVVILLDTGANIADMTTAELAGLQGRGFDGVIATNDLISLTAAQLTALGTYMIAYADVVTVTGAGADIAALNDTLLGSNGVDRVNATDNVLTLTLSQLEAYASLDIALTQTDLVTVSGSQDDLEELTAGEYAAFASAGVDIIDSTDGALDLEAGQASAIVNSGLVLSAGDLVGVEGTGDDIIAALGALIDELGDAGFDVIDADDDMLDLTVAQAVGLGSVVVADADLVTVVDTSAHIEAMTVAQFGALGPHGVDVIDAIDDELDLTVAQYSAIASEPQGPGQVPAAAASPVSLTGEDDITLLDTGAHIAGLSANEMSALYYNEVDAIDASDDVLNLSVDQIRALLDIEEDLRIDPLFDAPATVDLAGDDLITIYGTGNNLADLTVAEINGIFAAGVDTFDLTDGFVLLSNGQYQAYRAHGSFAASETVEVIGGNGANTITGGKEHNTLVGAGGADTLTGGGGSDQLLGGKGADRLSGGAGADVFLFERLSDSNTVSGVDRILDLGNDADSINLSGIDANNKASGDQAFTLTASLTGVAGQLAASYNSGTNVTTFSGDTNGDGVADVIIEAAGNHLTFTNFVL